MLEQFLCLAICQTEKIFIENIFSSCSKMAASITSTVDHVTWPMSEWNIKSFKMGPLYLSDTVRHWYQRGSTFICEHTKIHPSACNIICQEMLWYNPSLSKTHISTHSPACIHIVSWQDVDKLSQWIWLRVFPAQRIYTHSQCLCLTPNEVCTGSSYRQAIYRVDQDIEQSTRRHHGNCY